MMVRTNASCGDGGSIDSLVAMTGERTCPGDIDYSPKCLTEAQGEIEGSCLLCYNNNDIERTGFQQE